MSFGVGDLVECVVDLVKENQRWSVVPNRPAQRGIYTVRSIKSQRCPAVGLHDALLLAEISNPPMKWDDGTYEVAFSSGYFRPIRKTSIESLRKVVADVFDGVRA